jgi:hypothetical protein
MRSYVFEIFRGTLDRYAWRLVELDDGERHLLARSDRDYRSPEKARDAILALQAAIEQADIEETDGPPAPYPLPVTSFKFVSGVLPLPVEGSPVEHDAAEVHRRRRDSPSRRRQRNGEPDAAAAPPQEAAAAVPEPPAASTPKPPTRRGSRKARGT